jgi:hypothetical protein
MIPRNLALLRATVLAAVASIGSVSLAAQPAPGSYELSFFHSVFGGLEPVSSLPVCTHSGCEELILRAHVEDSSGSPAQRGLVTFQYCSLKGLPSNDISRPDEAPKAACDTRSAAWANLATFHVDDSGDAYYNFGVVLIPRTVGFRFRYSRGSDIAKGTSAAMDFLWTPAE